MAVGDFKKQPARTASDRATGGGSPSLSRGGMLVGIVVTALGVVVSALGGLDRLNNYGLDLHFRHLRTIEADPRIVLVDINDHAIEALGDWPWPRRRYAQLVSVLHELRAKSVVLDLVLADTSTRRIEHAAPSEQYDTNTQPEILANPMQEFWIYDDVELRDAIAAAGNVYIGMMSRVSPPGVDPGAVFDAGLSFVRQDPAISSTDFRSRLAPLFPSAGRVFDFESLYYQSRLLVALQDDFDLDAPPSLELLTPGEQPRQVHAVLPDELLDLRPRLRLPEHGDDLFLGVLLGFHESSRFLHYTGRLLSLECC